MYEQRACNQSIYRHTFAKDNQRLLEKRDPPSVHSPHSTVCLSTVGPRVHESTTTTTTTPDRLARESRVPWRRRPNTLSIRCALVNIKTNFSLYHASRGPCWYVIAAIPCSASTRLMIGCFPQCQGILSVTTHRLAYPVHMSASFII